MQNRAVLTTMLVLCGLAAGCLDTRQTSPVRTATEQLLVSKAGDRAADEITLKIPVGAKVFVDPTKFQGADGKDFDGQYLMGAIRDRVLRNGAALVNDKEKADVIVEARAGALSVDEEKLLIGIPSVEFPIPLAGPVKTPEVAFFKRAEQQGVAKIGVLAYDAKDGKMIDSVGPAYGYSYRKQWVVLLLFGWTDEDIQPENWRVGRRPWLVRDTDKCTSRVSGHLVSPERLTHSGPFRDQETRKCHVRPHQAALPRRSCRQPAAPERIAGGAREPQEGQARCRRSEEGRGRGDQGCGQAAGGCRAAVDHRRRVPPRLVAHGFPLPGRRRDQGAGQSHRQIPQ